MANVEYRADTALRRTDWGAIWGGVFCFMSIWAVFGSLGFAIFASAANPSTNTPVLNMSAGIAIWSIVLTIIAMYVAGRATGRLARVQTRHDGLLHGLMMFGLSVVATIVLVTLGGAALSGGAGVNGTAHSPYLLTVFANLGWAGFVALFLGWLAAMFGASSGVANRTDVAVVTTNENVREMRPAA